MAVIFCSAFLYSISRVESPLLLVAHCDDCHWTHRDVVMCYRYEELAVTLALDIDRLFDIRRKLEGSRLTCPLFDTNRWVRNFEAGLKLAWAKHEMGVPPADIDVPDAAVRAVGHSCSWCVVAVSIVRCSCVQRVRHCVLLTHARLVWSLAGWSRCRRAAHTYSCRGL